MKTFAECRAKLDELLADGMAASKENSNAKRMQVCKKYLKYVDDTDSMIDGTRDLDDLAFSAHDVLAREAMAGAISDIERRTAELSALGKDVERVAAEIEKSAASNRLTKVTAVISALTGVVGALDGLDDVWNDGDDDALRARAAALSAEIKKLESLFRKEL